MTTSFQKDSNSFKLQGATFDKWIFPQKETGQRTKPSLLSYVRHFKLLLIKVKVFEIWWEVFRKSCNCLMFGIYLGKRKRGVLVDFRKKTKAYLITLQAKGVRHGIRFVSCQ